MQLMNKKLGKKSYIKNLKKIVRKFFIEIEHKT